MDLYDNAEALREEVAFAKEQGVKVGFVPTMGALHDGHLSLVRASKMECDNTVVSIFVNPTQFNNPDDLANYPRNPEQDIALLERVAVDFLFTPSETEMYPDASARSAAPSVDLGLLDSVMEGAHRPGHFRGVVQVVHRLFDIVKPDFAYFGEKDYQQLAVIRSMTAQLKLPITIIGCPTLREPSGLAMSSRNQRLNHDERKEAAVLFQALTFVRKNWDQHPVKTLKTVATNMIEKSGVLKLEYIEIADGASLQPVESIDGTSHVRCFVAARIGDVRLIDNEMVTKPFEVQI